MENPVALWLGVALYAGIGLFGIFVIHDSTPSIRNLTVGYGVAYRTLANSEAPR
ncbi:MAG: hypothetical protein P4L80_03060 [Xanthobacteraceae bacterium]|nr:hypothetical protein [Xanthobacteraceae bacterium]